MADKGKALYEKHQRILADLLREEENKTCADCGGRGPRWASWNLGVFLCIRCAGIHRNLGVHVSRVKSVNLDSWTPDQISSIQKGGNRKAQLTYEATLPSEYKRPVDDYSVEQFIRNKYIKKSWASKDPVNGEVKKAANKPNSTVKNEVKTKQQPQEVKKPSQGKNTLSKPSNPHIGRSTSAPLKQPPPVVDLLSGDITLPTTTQQTPDRSKTSSFADQKTSHSASHLNTIQDSDSFFGVPKPASSQPEPMGKDAILSLYSSNQQQQGYNGMGYHPMYAYHHQQMAMAQAQHQMYYAQQQSQISQVQEKMARLKMRQQQETASANGSGTLNPHLW